MAEDGVQSPAGDQGTAEGTDSGLYNLDSVAPEVREQLAPHLKAIEGNVTKKFQEAADYRKQWEPYEETGIKDLDPESLKGLLEFAQMANDPEQFSQWWQKAGEEMDLFNKDEGEEDLGFEDLSQEKINELISEQVAERLSPIEQSLAQQEQASKEAQANEEINQEMNSIRGENAALFKGDEKAQKKVEERVAQLAFSYSDDNSLSAAEMIRKGFEDYQEMIGQGEKGLFDQKANQPGTPEGAGAADLSAEKITSFDDPRLKQSAREQLRQSLST